MNERILIPLLPPLAYKIQPRLSSTGQNLGNRLIGGEPGPGGPGRVSPPTKHENVIFLISHRSASFTGYYAAVDFYQGKGSTSSIHDAIRLLELGCKIEDKAQRVKVEEFAAWIRAERKKAEEAKAAEVARENWPGNPFTEQARAERERRADEVAKEAKAARATNQRARWKRAHASQYQNWK